MMLVREYPPLDLDVELVAADGHVRQLTGDGAPGDRPQGLQLTSKRGDGFSTSGFSLARRIDRDWPDLGLYDGVNLVSAAGDVAWEGRMARQPRQADQAHSIGIDAIGWIQATRDTRMSAIYVDRDLAAWEGMSVKRRSDLLTAGHSIVDSLQVAPDGTDPNPLQAVMLSYDHLPSTVPAGPYRHTEAYYIAPNGLRISRLYYDVITKNLGAGWNVETYLADNDQLGGNELNLVSSAGGGGAGYQTTTATSRAVAMIRHLFVGTFGGGDNTWATFWRKLAVYGDHGLPLIGTTDPKGVAASDVVRHIINNWCPQLVAGEHITPTSYPISHLAFRDRVFPYDAISEINKFHLFELAVWEGRQVHWGPADLTDYDWEIRLDDPGVTVQLQGDSAEDLANGIEVEYDNVVTGRREVLLPADHPELRDGDVEHPATRHGLQVDTAITLSSPTDQGGALQLGRAALAEYNQPKAPGSITASNYVRDRAGNWQPAWKVRSGQTVAITSSTAFSDRPRLIGEANYSHDNRTVTIAVDSTIQRLEAFQDRVATSLKAQGLA